MDRQDMLELIDEMCLADAMEARARPGTCTRIRSQFQRQHADIMADTTRWFLQVGADEGIPELTTPSLAKSLTLGRAQDILRLHLCGIPLPTPALPEPKRAAWAAVSGLVAGLAAEPEAEPPAPDGSGEESGGAVSWLKRENKALLSENKRLKKALRLAEQVRSCPRVMMLAASGIPIATARILCHRAQTSCCA